MNLESVRELKRSLQGQLLAKLATTVQARSALGEAAQALGMRRAPPPTLALGVARRARNRFALAVRVQQRALEHSRTVEDLTKLARARWTYAISAWWRSAPDRGTGSAGVRFASAAASAISASRPAHSAHSCARKTADR